MVKGGRIRLVLSFDLLLLSDPETFVCSLASLDVLGWTFASLMLVAGLSFVYVSLLSSKN